MKGLGYIPHVNGWMVFTITGVAIFALALFVPMVTGFLTTIANAIPAPVTGNLIFTVFLLAGITTIVIKVIDAPKPRLGSGKRFNTLEHQLAHQKGIKNPAGLAASIGRKKFGPARYAQLSAQGRRRPR